MYKKLYYRFVLLTKQIGFTDHQFPSVKDVYVPQPKMWTVRIPNIHCITGVMRRIRRNL